MDVLFLVMINQCMDVLFLIMAPYSCRWTYLYLYDEHPLLNGVCLKQSRFQFEKQK